MSLLRYDGNRQLLPEKPFTGLCRAQDTYLILYGLLRIEKVHVIAAVKKFTSLH